MIRKYSWCQKNHESEEVRHLSSKKGGKEVNFMIDGMGGPGEATRGTSAATHAEHRRTAEHRGASCPGCAASELPLAAVLANQGGNPRVLAQLLCVNVTSNLYAGVAMLLEVLQEVRHD